MFFNFAVVMKAIDPQIRSILNRETMPIGRVFESNGEQLCCVERPDVEFPRDACSGCYYSQNYVTCPKSQCSSLGRTDGKNVWFVKIEDHEDNENC